MILSLIAAWIASPARLNGSLASSNLPRYTQGGALGLIVWRVPQFQQRLSIKQARRMMLLRMAGMIANALCLGAAAPAAVYRAPLAVAVSPDGKTLYVSDKTADCVVVLDAVAGKKVCEVAIAGNRF